MYESVPQLKKKFKNEPECGKTVPPVRSRVISHSVKPRINWLKVCPKKSSNELGWESVQKESQTFEECKKSENSVQSETIEHKESEKDGKLENQNGVGACRRKPYHERLLFENAKVSNPEKILPLKRHVRFDLDLLKKGKKVYDAKRQSV